MASQSAMALRDSLFKSYLGTFIWDSWSHADTRTQMTTWAMIVHVTFFGSSSDAARRLLHGPAFFLSHSVLAGWLQLTYFNPQIDLRDKLEKWGMTPKVAIPRTLMVHVFTVLAHWLLLVAERTDLRRLHKGMGLKELLARSVVPQFCLLLIYGRLHHNIAKTYNIPVENERLHNLQTAVIVASNALAFPLWRHLIASK